MSECLHQFHEKKLSAHLLSLTRHTLKRFTQVFSFFSELDHQAITNLPLFPKQESGRDTPSANQASSINGTDDEKISHVSPEAAVLKSENERLKSEVEQRLEVKLALK